MTKLTVVVIHVLGCLLCNILLCECSRLPKPFAVVVHFWSSANSICGWHAVQPASATANEFIH